MVDKPWNQSSFLQHWRRLMVSYSAWRTDQEAHFSAEEKLKERESRYECVLFIRTQWLLWYAHISFNRYLTFIVKWIFCWWEVRTEDCPLCTFLVQMLYAISRRYFLSKQSSHTPRLIFVAKCIKRGININDMYTQKECFFCYRCAHCFYKLSIYKNTILKKKKLGWFTCVTAIICTHSLF